MKKIIFISIALLWVTIGCDQQKANQQKAEEYLGQGKMYFEQKTYDLAIEAYEKVKNLKNINDDEARLCLGKIYIEQKIYYKTVNELEFLCKYGNNAEAYNLTGIARMQQKNPYLWKNPSPSAYKAIKDFEKAVQIDPNYAEAYINLGHAYSCASLFDYSNKDRLAAEACRKAIQLKPDDPAGYYNLGIVYIKSQNDKKRAVEAFQKAIQMKPDYADAYTGMGIAYWHLIKGNLAIESFQKSIQMKPDNAWAYYELGHVYSDLLYKKYKDALQAYEEAAKIDPDATVNPGIYTLLGIARENNGMYAEAVEAFKRAIQINSEQDWYAKSSLNRVLDILEKQKPL